MFTSLCDPLEISPFCPLPRNSLIYSLFWRGSKIIKKNKLEKKLFSLTLFWLQLIEKCKYQLNDIGKVIDLLIAIHGSS